jgi:microcystin-dependent protein
LTAYNVIDPGKLVAGLPEDISVILANLQAIAAALGSLDNANISPAAQIAISKLAGYPADGSKALLGDGTWGTVSGGSGGGGTPPPTGAVFQFAGTAAPAGYLMCDGAPVSRTTYSALFAIVGAWYGTGDGSTTFNLPDLQGRVAVGKGFNADVTDLGMNEGVAGINRTPKHNSSSTGFTLPDHGHSVGDGGHSHTYEDYVVGGTVGVSQGASPSVSVNGRQYNTNLQATGITVGNPTSHPPMSGTVGPGGTRPVDAPAYLVLNHIIKT